MTTYIDKVRDALAFAISAIRSGEGYSAECQRVFESAKSALSAHEAEVRVREAVLAELVALLNKSVNVLQRHAPPDGLSDHDALSEFYSIFDGPEYQTILAKVKP